MHMIVILLVAFCASAAGQDCGQLVSRDTVRMDRNQPGLMSQASPSDSVIFSCTAETANRDAYAAATAYIAGYLLDYRCTDPVGWEQIGLDNVTEIHDRDIPDGTCSACVVVVPGTSTTPSGHCQRESLYMPGLAGRGDNK